MKNFGNLDKKTIEILINQGIIKESDLEKIIINKDKKYDNILVRDSLNDFVEFLEKDMASSTVSGYRIHVEDFLRYLYDADSLETIEEMSLKQVTNVDAKNWFKKLAANGYSNATIRRTKHSLKKYFEFLKGKGYKSPNIGDIETPKSDFSDVFALHHDEIWEIANHASNYRDKAIILFLYESGMRRNELINCMKEDIDFQTGLVRVNTTKGNKRVFDRNTYISERMINALKGYIEQLKDDIGETNKKRLKAFEKRGREYKEKADSGYLFQTMRTEKVSYSVVFRAIKETAFKYYYDKAEKSGMCEKAKDYAEEMSENVDTETLRHSRRAYLLAMGQDVDKVLLIMGDSNKHILKRYYRTAQELYPERFNINVDDK